MASEPSASGPAGPSNVLQTFAAELNSLGLELQARRVFCDDAIAFIRGLDAVPAFEAFRKARRASVDGQKPALDVVDSQDDGPGDVPEHLDDVGAE